ncbi:MAG: PQQ-binding-like beta-propeller repeat protein [Bacteroidota bacterium]
MNKFLLNKQRSRLLCLLLFISTFSQIACEEGTVISDFDPDVTISVDLYAIQGNTLHALRDNRAEGQDFSKINEIDPRWSKQIPGEISIGTPFLIKEGQFQEQNLYLSSADGVVYKYTDKGELVWSFDTGGGIVSSVHAALAGESAAIFTPLIYVGNQNGRFVCLDGADGSLIWEYQIENRSAIESEAQYAKRGGRDHIIFGADDGYIYCFDGGSGEKLWDYYTGASIKSKGKTINGIRHFAVGNILGDVIKIDIETGNVAWTKTLPNSVVAAPEAGRNREYFVGCNDGSMYALDGESGDILWQYKTEAAIVGSAFITEVKPGENENLDPIPMLFFGSIDEHLYALNASDGNLIWRKNLGAGQLAASPIAHGESSEKSTVYMNTSEGLISVSSRTGEFQTRFNNQTEGNYTSSVMPYFKWNGRISVGSTYILYPNNLN